MMERYIVEKEALNILNINGEDAVSILQSDITITDEVLVYKNMPYVAMPLAEEQKHILEMKGIHCRLDNYEPVKTLGSDYEKVRAKWIKPQKRNYTGKGVKVALIDSGCNITHVPVDVAYNFIDNNTTITDSLGHGTKTTSIIKSSIGLAPDCIIHHLKTIGSGGSTTLGAILAAFDYCITNSIDVVNMSWQYGGVIDVEINEMITAGIVCVAASGNSTTDAETEYPAGYNGVIAVNSIQEDGTPKFKSYMTPSFGGHGVDVSCSGASCQLINSAGSVVAENGTSYSAPFFVGAFAIYKEMLGISDNYAVLSYMKKRFIKNDDPILKATLTF